MLVIFSSGYEVNLVHNNIIYDKNYIITLQLQHLLKYLRKIL
jgi:hypothetical protein